MAKLLLFGLAPFPFENELKSFGPGVRTWQLARPLVDDGHDLTVVTWRIPGSYREEPEEELREEIRGFRRISLGDERFADDEFRRSLVDSLKPDAIIGATIYGSHAAVRAATSEPVWVDLFGHVMAEAQARASVVDANDCVPYFFKLEREVVCRGDVFSSVGRAQSFATIGELGAAGRLRKETLGYRFVATIPCAMDSDPLPPRASVLRGKEVDEDAFVLLWSGGYNTWTDVGTLFAGIELAMAENPRIRFVSTGGAIDGHDETTYPRFLELIAGAKHPDRYVMKGWIDKEIALCHYFEADLGINIDRYMYEGLLGSKNRILDWMRAGLPALAGELSEISKLIGEEKLGFTFPLGRPDELAKTILNLAAHPEEVKQAGRLALGYGQTHLTFKKTTEPLRAWARAPSRSPDADCEPLLPDPEGRAYARKLEGELAAKENFIKDLERHIRNLDALAAEKSEALAALRGDTGGFRLRSQGKRLLRALGLAGLVKWVRNR